MANHLQVRAFRSSIPKPHQVADLPYDIETIMLAQTMQDVSYMPLATADPGSTLPWHEQGDVFVPYEEEEAMLSNAYGIQVRISRPPSPSDPTAHERWVSRLRNAIGPMEQLEEDDVIGECLDPDNQQTGDIIGLDETELRMEQAPKQAIFLHIPPKGGVTA